MNEFTIVKLFSIKTFVWLNPSDYTVKISMGHDLARLVGLLGFRETTVQMSMMLTNDLVHIDSTLYSTKCDTHTGGKNLEDKVLLKL